MAMEILANARKKKANGVKPRNVDLGQNMAMGRRVKARGKKKAQNAKPRKVDLLKR